MAAGSQSVRRGKHERSATGLTDCVEAPRGHALGVFIVTGPWCQNHNVRFNP